MKFLRTLFAVFQKDILSEMRVREGLNTILFFGVLIIFLFSFAFGIDPNLLKSLSPGLLWLVVLFCSLLALGRSFQAETEDGCMDRLILHSVSMRALFLGKLLTNLTFILIVQSVVLVLMFFLFNLESPESWGRLLLALFLGDFGIATLGTFYAALIAKIKAKEVLLPLLLFPMLTPLLLASVFATQQALTGDLLGESGLWLKLLFLFDSIFLAATLLVIGPLLESC